MANVFNQPPKSRGGSSPRDSCFFKMDVNFLCLPSFALIFALYSTFFSHLNLVLASVKVDCTESYSIPAQKGGRSICVPFDGQSQHTYFCDPQLCSKPVLPDCHPDPPRRSRQPLPVNPTIGSYKLYGNNENQIGEFPPFLRRKCCFLKQKDDKVGYEGPWPSPNTPKNKRPPRFVCRRRGGTPASAHSARDTIKFIICTNQLLIPPPTSLPILH
ncbi:hypothetical protein O181_014267 [Austropuccinia psidii MF-1]|uniref:Uncharacterized protein n=1 Tax=Austropuccinia psidii MF-1 TaxID=1389203 RepID=A0A9Q3GPP3_9BASI|nr:hypothetical protein [Austropuccinia psidii MF-1]